MISLSAKTKGEGRSPSVGGNALLGGRQKFLADGVAGGAKIWWEEKIVGLARIFKDFFLN